MRVGRDGSRGASSDNERGVYRRTQRKTGVSARETRRLTSDAETNRSDKETRGQGD